MRFKLFPIRSRSSSLLKLPLMLILSCLLVFAPDIKAADILVVQNALVSRTLVAGSTTSTLSLKSETYDFARPGSREFSFSIDGTEINGLNGLVQYKQAIREASENRLRLILEGLPGTPAEDLLLELHYQALPGEPALEKYMIVRNQGQKALVLTDILWEAVNADPWGGANAAVSGIFGRYPFKPPYQGFHEDPALVVTGEKGVVTALNMAPGMTRYTAYCHGINTELAAGFRDSGNPYATNIRLAPGDSFTSPAAVLFLSGPGSSPSGLVLSWLRKENRTRMFSIPSMPGFLYNTWVPFGVNINEQLIRELADALQGTGAEYLIIDDGWQDRYGDWNAHPERFPSGMKSISDYITARGMKPGIWISLTTCETESEAFRRLESYAVKDQYGRPSNLHGWANNLVFYTMSILSPWYEHIREQIFRLVEEEGFRYLKIDLSMVKSAYITDPVISGNYDTTAVSASRQEYYYPAYLALMRLFDELYKTHPEVIIDCTYELWGDHHATDFALVRHAHTDWISNFFSTGVDGSRQVRQLAWSRGNFIPVETMAIGNQQMDAPNHRFSFLSQFSGIPLMLGDPRKLSPDEKAWYLKMSNWRRQMSEQYETAGYYSTIGFDAPSEHNWDGFVKYNPILRGGIVCVFRNDSPDAARQIALHGLDPKGRYRILSPENRSLGTYTGEELMRKGIRMEIGERNSGVVFEIRGMP